MNKKLLTIGIAGAILIFSSNGLFGQEIAKTLDQKKTRTEQINKDLNDTLNYNQINKQKYQEQKNKMIKNGDKESFKKLIEEYLSNIKKEVIQNPELRRHELEMLYYDCEFADIQIPQKLEEMLSLTDSRVNS